MVWLSLIGVAVGTTCAGSVVHVPNRSSSIARVDLVKLTRLHWIRVITLCAFAATQLMRAEPLVRSAGGYLAVLISAGGDLRRASLASSVEAAQTALDASGALSGVTNYVLFAGHISLFTGALLWKLGRQRLAILPVLISAAYGVLSLQRSSFVMAILLFGTTIVSLPCLKSQNGQNEQTLLATSARRKRGIWQSVTICSTGIVAVLLPLYWRNVGTRNATGLDSLGQYFVSGIMGLNARNTWNSAWNPPPGNEFATVGPDPGFGAYTFGNIFSVLNRLGLDVPTAPNFYDYYYVQVWGQRFATNTGTSIVDFYYDFGMFGILAAFVLLSFGGTALQMHGKKGDLRKIVHSSYSSWRSPGPFSVVPYSTMFAMPSRA